MLSSPYPFSLLYTLYGIFEFPRTCQNPEHTCWFCPQTQTHLAQRCGFRVVEWTVVEDYRTDDSSSRYRLFVRPISMLRKVIPQRLRNNTMIFVLEVNYDEDCSRP